jgi:hypothetical protein
LQHIVNAAKFVHSKITYKQKLTSVKLLA